MRYTTQVGAPSPSASLRIQERFVSVQGEGALVGTPSSFIRVAGCNLRCDWCDSPASSWAPTGETIEVQQLIDEAAKGPRHVVVTGGEPLLFEATHTLVQGLRAAGHHLTIETAGTVLLEDFACDLMSISPKLAHSTPSPERTRLAQAHERDRFAPAVIQRLRMQAPQIQLKYVVRSEHVERDLLEIDAQLREIDPGGALDPADVFLMPEGTDAQELELAYARVLPHCQARGNRLGQRLHIHLFGHRPGT